MIEFFRFQTKRTIPLRSGPLAAYLGRFAALLVRLGYRRSKVWQKVCLAADLGQWLARKGLQLEQLGEREVDAFLEARWKRRRRRSGDSSTVTLLLEHLRQAGAIPAPRPPPVRSSLDRIVGNYEQFLRHERCLGAGSIGTYLPVVRRFLHHRFAGDRVQLRRLRASDAADFILRTSTSYGRRYLQSATSTLRSFFNFLLQRGHISTPLAKAVPTVAARRLAELPKFLEAAQVEKLLKSCDRRRRVGRRDRAMLLLLARLGLRGGEVAQLHLEDIDWQAGEVRVRGKGPRSDRLPLPQDVGQAIVDYLQKGRPRCPSRHVFIRCLPPYQALSRVAASNVVRAALRRADLHPHHQGAHLLRHSLATRMLRRGASLTQIGQVLRHQLAQTTEIYAKVDLNALRRLARPWPGGAR
jgi:integrase/recombinase XerD